MLGKKTLFVRVLLLLLPCCCSRVRAPALTGNGIGADGAREIAAVLKENKTLQHLILESACLRTARASACVLFWILGCQVSLGSLALSERFPLCVHRRSCSLAPVEMPAHEGGVQA